MLRLADGVDDAARVAADDGSAEPVVLAHNDTETQALCDAALEPELHNEAELSNDPVPALDAEAATVLLGEGVRRALPREEADTEAEEDGVALASIDDCPELDVSALALGGKLLSVGTTVSEGEVLLQRDGGRVMLPCAELLARRGEAVGEMLLKPDALRVRAGDADGQVVAVTAREGDGLAESEAVALAEAEDAGLHVGCAESPGTKQPAQVQGIGAPEPGGQYDPTGQITWVCEQEPAGQ